MIEWDLIGNLHQHGFDHILDQIFGYLDYYCLRNAELVSSVWQKSILEGKIWKKLLNRNVSIFPCWSDMCVALKGMKLKNLDFLDNSPEYYRNICCFIAAEMQLLESNWKKMKYSERISEFGPLHYSDYSDYFELNGNWIVRIQKDRRIVIRNRWTLEIENILEIPIMQIQFKGEIPILNSVKMNDSFIVASFCRHPEICVWNTKTKDLMFVVDGGALCIQQNEEDSDDILFSCGLSLWKNFMLACHTRSFDGSWIVTLRSLPSSIDEEVKILNQTVIAGPGRFGGLLMDEIYILLFFSKSSPAIRDTEEEFFIEIRNTISFEIKTTIKFDEENMPHEFDYSNGLVVTCLSKKPIRIWDVVTGQCITKISYRETLSGIRLVSNKYIVSCDDLGKLKIWDLQTALKMNGKPNSKCLIKTISPPGVPYVDMFVRPSITADKFQIVVITQFDRHSFSMNVKNFLGAAK